MLHLYVHVWVRHTFSRPPKTVFSVAILFRVGESSSSLLFVAAAGCFLLTAVEIVGDADLSTSDSAILLCTGACAFLTESLRTDFFRHGRLLAAFPLSDMPHFKFLFVSPHSSARLGRAIVDIRKDYHEMGKLQSLFWFEPIIRSGPTFSL